ncbi:MAG: FHA domain-containing protein [Gammaproteobacteria bacterium]|nr:FHA domain-containing protein [Gammaproteobacteria bacterium]
MAYLRIFRGDTLLEQRELTDAHTTIGRADDNAIVLQGRGVSKHHAVIERSDDGYLYIDRGSANGSFISGQRVERHPLAYWDEIQIFDYVLKFMAVARARGEEAGVPEPALQAQEETMELDIGSLGDLARLKRRARVAALLLERPDASEQRFSLERVNFSIGRAPDSDLRIGGWLAPRTAARIQRRSDGFYLLPGRRGKVRINGIRVLRQARLSDGDRLSVRGVPLQFLYRPLDQG